MVNEQFTGNIFIFHAFDVGEDINFEKFKRKQLLFVYRHSIQNILKIIILL